MNNFKDGGFKRGGKDFGGRPKFGGGGTPSRGRRPGGGVGGGNRGARPQEKMELFTTTCTACHKSCEVPFRPSADKPVYCSACFGKKNSDESRGDRGDSRGEFRPRNDFRGERSSTRPEREYAPAASENARGGRDAGLEEVKQQLKTIEARLNRILDLINPPTPPTKAAAVVAEVEKTETLPKKERKPKTVKVKKVAKKAAKKVAKKAKK